jgi:hypothetical protein
MIIHDTPEAAMACAMSCIQGAIDAVHEEREACAKLAEYRASELRNTVTGGNGVFVAEQIAFDIRHQ